MKVVPQTQELNFTYLPNGAEIISLDAFNRCYWRLISMYNVYRE